MLDRQLDLALRGSDSLNSRGTTLAGLLGTTIALVGAASIKVAGQVDSLPPAPLFVMTAFFAIALVALGACVVVALTAVRPNRESSRRLQAVVESLMSDSFDERMVRRSTWLALLEQRSANDRKSERMRLAYVLAWVGIVAVVIANGIYCGALSA